MRDPPLPPFRWDITRREQLGSLVAGPEVETYRGFYEDIRTASAKIVARTDSSDLVFVGRSVENVFDYLAGLFADLAERPRLTLLPFSSPGHDVPTLLRTHRAEVAALQARVERLGVDPAAIVARGRQIRFVDVVRTGASFEILIGLMRHWSEVQTVDWGRVRRLVGVLGLTWQGKNSPKTWRWQQHSAWVPEFPRANVSNISVPPRFWSWIGNHEVKTMPSFSIDRWAANDGSQPDRHEWHLQGMRLALSLHERARSKAERLKFAAALAELPEMKARSLRAIVTSLRGR